MSDATRAWAIAPSWSVFLNYLIMILLFPGQIAVRKYKLILVSFFIPTHAKLLGYEETLCISMKQKATVFQIFCPPSIPYHPPVRFSTVPSTGKKIATHVRKDSLDSY